MSVLIYAVRLLCDIIAGLLVVRALMSWIVNPQYSDPNSILYKINSVIISATEPIVRPFRNLLSRFNTGPIDFSIFVAIMAIYLFEMLFSRTLVLFM